MLPAHFIFNIPSSQPTYYLSYLTKTGGWKVEGLQKVDDNWVTMMDLSKYFKVTEVTKVSAKENRKKALWVLPPFSLTLP